jgi:hypothetical protein
MMIDEKKYIKTVIDFMNWQELFLRHIFKKLDTINIGNKGKNIIQPLIYE